MIYGNYFLLEYPKEKLEKIEFNKKLDFKWNNKLAEKLDNIKIYYKKKRGIQRFRESQTKERSFFLFDFSPYYNNLLNLKKDAVYLQIDNIIKKNKKYNDCCIFGYLTEPKIFSESEIKNKRFKKLVSNVISDKIREKIENNKYCAILEELYLSYLFLIEKLYDHLEINGSFWLAFYFQPCDRKYIEIIYLLSLLFNKVLILDGREFLCMGFRGEFGLKREEFKKIKESKTFDIIPKPEINDLNKYYKTIMNFEIERVKNIQEENNTKLLPLLIKKGIKDILYVDFQSSYFNSFLARLESLLSIKVDTSLIYDFLEKEYKNQLNNLSSVLIKNLKNKNNKILEIGMGLGLFSKILIKVTNKQKNTNLIISDLEQSNIWDKEGLKYINSELKKNKKNINFTQKDPLFLLPELLKENGKESFDIVMFNKSYNFDRIVCYLEYINLLLKKNGILIFNKVLNRTDLNINEYIKHNYTFMEKIQNKYFDIYLKINDDERRINDFFSF